MNPTWRKRILLSVALLTSACVRADVLDTLTLDATFTAPGTTAADGVARADVSIVVKDARGGPVEGAQVLLAPPSANLAVYQAALTDVQGKATASVSSTLSGAQTLQAEVRYRSHAMSVPNAVTISFVNLQPQGTLDTSHTSLAVSPNTTTASATSGLTVTMSMRSVQGQPLVGRSVVFTADGGANSWLTPNQGATDANGLFSAQLASTLAQNENVVAYADGASFKQVVHFVAGTPSAARTTFVAYPNAVVADGNHVAGILLTLADAQGNRLANQNVTLSADDANCQLSATQLTTDALGQYVLTATSTHAAVVRLTLTPPNAVVGSVTFVAGPWVPAKTTFTISPNTLVADRDAAAQLRVRVVDAHDNLVANHNVRITTPHDGMRFSSALAGRTSASVPFGPQVTGVFMGRKTFTATIDGTQTLTASVSFASSAPYCADTLLMPGMPRIAADAPHTVKVADFNHDGRTDLLIGNTGAAIAVALGAPHGFLSALPLPNNGGATSMAIADFNADGNQDIAMAQTGGPELKTFLGLGDGSFSFAQTTAPCASTGGVATGDVDRDGKVDVFFTCSSSSGVVGVALGLGDGTLGAAHTFAAGNTPQGPVLADFNGDGMLDAAVASYSGSGVQVMRGMGDGNFTAPVTFATDNNAWSITAVDVTGDGILDLLVPNFNSVSVLTGRGDGSFAAKAKYLADYDTEDAMLADINGDSLNDLVAPSSGGRTLRVATGTGGGDFGPMRQVTIGAHYASAVSADFDGDAIKDIVLADGFFSGIDVFLNRQGQIKLPISYNGLQYSSGMVVDIDDDGHLDYIGTLNYTSGVHIFLGNGDGTLRNYYEKTTGSRPQGVVAVDLNEDTALDIVTANSASSDVSVLLATSRGKFDAAEVHYAVRFAPSGIDVGDVNGDGHADVVVGNNGDASVSVLTGDGRGNLTLQGNVPAGNGPGPVKLGDFNADGVQDLVVTNLFGGNANILLGVGDGNFVSFATLPAAFHPRSPAVTDMDGDGVLDVIIPSESLPQVQVFLGVGDGSFQLKTTTTLPGPSTPYAASVGDVNGDGFPDILIADQFIGVRVLLGDGTGNLSAPLWYATAEGTQHAAVGDMDEDGKVDIVSSSLLGEVHVLRYAGCY